MQEPKTMTIDFGNGLETYVLTPKNEWDKEQKQKAKDDDQTKKIDWAYKVTGIKSYNGLTAKLLKFKDQLDIENGGCVYYPESKGSPYKFIGPEFKEFVSRHRSDFMKAVV